MNETVHASITSTKNNIDIVDQKEKSQKLPEAVVSSKNKKNDTFDKEDNSNFIPVTNIYNIITQIKHP